MPFGAYLFFIIFNITLVLGINHFQNRAVKARIRRMKQEIQELEDLVVAIVAEIEDAVGEGTAAPDAALPEITAQSKERSSFDDSTPSNPPANRRVFLETEVVNPKHRQILDLWQQGMEMPQIARKLRIGQGEIRLILGLYKRS
jgi:DNA-binding NarL/FixJ family response regulator